MAKKKSKKNKKRISLCMIVKNEEKFLPQCLKSVKDYVDEIVVVDTGSTDRTIEIAESYGANVYHHPWENNFSKHRNQSISYASGDWILIMDADEKLDAKTAPLIRAVVNEAPTAVIAFNVRSYQENGIYYTESGSPRLFKNGLNFHYRGYVHNQLFIQDKITPSPIILWHYGYDISPDQMKNKQQKSLKLLKKQIKEFPDDLPTRHHLAMTLMAMKEFEEAYREAKLTLEKMDAQGVFDNSFSWTYFVAAESLINLERFDEAESVCLKGLITFDWSLDLHHCLARIKFVKKEYNKVLEHGHEFLRLRDELQNDISRFTTFNFETVQRDWVILRAMGYAHLYQDQHDEGIDFLEKALRRTPGCDRDTLTEEIGLNLTKLKKWDKAIWFLKKLPADNEKYERGLQELGANYERLGRLDEAVTLYDRIETTFEENAEIPFKRGLLLLKLNRHDEAAAAFEKAVKRKPDHVDAWINWGLALEEQGAKDVAEGKYRAALAIDPDSAKGNLNLGLFYFKQSDYARAREYLKKCTDDLTENVYLLLALSRGHLEAGDLESMIVVCEKILRLLNLPADLLIESVSQVAELFVGIAGKLLEEKRFESFEIALDMVKHLGPESTGGLKRLSRLAFNMNEPVRGASILETVLSIDPKDPEILSLMQGHIKELEA
ncbi:MAG TPA: tetratricopeptide repeat protein [Anaerolineae bacterium]|nr:tetratricopeptide repeat protein [Anaerolineae bacterium]